eukprot:TRINITY_DN160363_c0_g1_i1.p1 TRINITY_DN160363_c0_g1~~TRINITY_DN160363_c0_g1_i1.p1  ORF type:complete len:751 (-),score=205.31 TRINITY_DN160363_c0_g1_i1:706-2958(-)
MPPKLKKRLSFLQNGSKECGMKKCSNLIKCNDAMCQECVQKCKEQNPTYMGVCGSGSGEVHGIYRFSPNRNEFIIPGNSANIRHQNICGELRWVIGSGKQSMYSALGDVHSPLDGKWEPRTGSYPCPLLRPIGQVNSLSGTMFKLGYVHRAWRMRFFVIAGSDLHYFTSPVYEDEGFDPSDARGAFSLVGASIEPREKLSKPPHSYVFFLKRPGRPVRRLGCETHEQRENWMQTLQIVIDLVSSENENEDGYPEYSEPELEVNFQTPNEEFNNTMTPNYGSLDYDYNNEDELSPTKIAHPLLSPVITQRKRSLPEIILPPLGFGSAMDSPRANSPMSRTSSTSSANGIPIPMARQFQRLERNSSQLLVPSEPPVYSESPVLSTSPSLLKLCRTESNPCRRIRFSAEATEFVISNGSQEIVDVEQDLRLDKFTAQEVAELTNYSASDESGSEEESSSDDGFSSDDAKAEELSLDTAESEIEFDTPTKKPRKHFLDDENENANNNDNKMMENEVSNLSIETKNTSITTDDDSEEVFHIDSPLATPSENVHNSNNFKDNFDDSNKNNNNNSSLSIVSGFGDDEKEEFSEGDEDDDYDGSDLPTTPRSIETCPSPSSSPSKSSTVKFASMEDIVGKGSPKKRRPSLLDASRDSIRVTRGRGNFFQKLKEQQEQSELAKQQEEKEKLSRMTPEQIDDYEKRKKEEVAHGSKQKRMFKKEMLSYGNRSSKRNLLERGKGTRGRGRGSRSARSSAQI